MLFSDTQAQTSTTKDHLYVHLNKRIGVQDRNMGSKETEYPDTKSTVGTYH